MNRKLVIAAFVVLGGTFTIGVGCGGSTSNNTLGDGANNTGGAGGAGGAGGGAVSTGGSPGAGGAVGTAGANGGASPSTGGHTTSAGGTATGAGGTATGTGGKAGAATAGHSNGGTGVSTGGTGTAGNTTALGGSTSAAGGNVTNGGSPDQPDASNPFDVDIPDVSFGMDATAAGCYGCIASSCPTQIATCQQDAKCTTAVQCVIDTCQGATDFMCVLGCGQSAGIMSQMDPAAQALIGVVECSGQACTADCGGGMMGNPIGGGQGMGGNTGMGTGGTGAGGTTTTCNMGSCATACGKDIQPCFKDKVCQACLKNPNDQGCSANMNFTNIQTCCNATASCSGCGFCPGLASAKARRMELVADAKIPFPRAAVFATYRDKLAELIPYLPNVRAIEVRERREVNGNVEFDNVWHGGGEIPVAARAFLSEKMLSWTDYAIWNETEWKCDWRIETHAFTEAVTCKGTNRYFEENGVTRIEIRGNLTIDSTKISGVPRLLAGKVSKTIEEFLGNKIRPNLVEVSDGVRKYLEKTSALNRQTEGGAIRFTVSVSVREARSEIPRRASSSARSLSGTPLCPGT